MSESEARIWTEWTPEKEEKFFKSIIATGGNVTAACKLVRIARSSAYLRKEQDTEFASKWSDAVESGVDALEAEARRRALKGCKKAVYYKGQVVGYEREYSDLLLILLLKGNRPEKYKERHEVSGKDGKPIEHEHSITVNIVKSDRPVKNESDD